jgi:hypothetical protein
MSDTVVDSSVVAKWILPEPDSAHAYRLIDEVALKGERLIVLDLAFAEVANAIWKRHYRVWPHWTKHADPWPISCRVLSVLSRPIGSSNRPWKSPQNISVPFTMLCLSPSARTWGCRASRRMNHCITWSTPTSLKSFCCGTGREVTSPSASPQTAPPAESTPSSAHPPRCPAAPLGPSPSWAGR